MNRPLAVTIAAALIALGSPFSVSPAVAGPSEHLNWGQELNAGEDACPSGDKILNINYKITNSLDSGTGTSVNGNVYWAYIDYVLQVQVIQIDADSFCARVKTQGSFESIGGDGPGCDTDGTCGNQADQLEAGVVGTFQGGFTGTFDGTFAAAGRTSGSLGTFDHACDATTGTCTGSGVFRWLGLYFTGVSNDNLTAWWGWVYHAGANGSWVNSGDGNSGNITGE